MAPDQPTAPDMADRPARRARWTAQPLVGVALEKGRLAEGLAARLAALIETGVWAAGMKLPSTRTLAKDHGISRNTAIAALGILATEGLIGMRDRSVAHVLPGKAKPAAAPVLPPRPEPVLAAFEIGYARPWPVPEWAALERRVWRDAAAPLAAAPVQGLATLRREIAGKLLGAKGLAVAPERLFVTESDVESLRLILDSAPAPVALVLDCAAFDAPQATALAELLRRPVVRATSEAHFGRSDNGARAFATSPARRRANGAPLRAAERSALLAWAERRDALLLELDEDWATISPSVRPAASLAAGSDRVFHLTDFGRMISPDCAVAAILCPAEAVDRLARRRAAGRGAIHAGLQAWAAAFLRDGHFGPHLRRRGAAFETRALALARAGRAAFGTLVEVRPALYRDSVRLRIAAERGEALAACLRANGFWVSSFEDGGDARLRVTSAGVDADDGRIAMAMAAAARLFAAG